MTAMYYILLCGIAVASLLIGFYIGNRGKGKDCGVLQVVHDSYDGDMYLYLDASRDPSEMAKLGKVSFQVRNITKDRWV